MRDDLGVGLAANAAPSAFELFAQLAEILDDAVVDDGDVVGRMRMRIGSRSACRGSPSGCGRCRHGRRAARLVSRASRLFSLPSARRRSSCAAFQRRDAGRIVAAIFEPLQRIDQLLRDRPTSRECR